MNTKKQGSIWVAKAILFYTENWYSVFTPVSDVSRFDIIIERDWVLKRVEVKTCRAKNNEFMLRTNWWNKSGSWKTKFLSSNDCDIVFLYNINSWNIKEFDISEIEWRSSIKFS